MCGVFVSLTETPLSLAVQCEPSGGEAIRVLVEGGAHIDFRSKDGLTPVHKAVRGHRHTALLVNIHVSFQHPNPSTVILKNTDIQNVASGKRPVNVSVSAGFILALKLMQNY